MNFEDRTLIDDCEAAIYGLQKYVKEIKEKAEQEEIKENRKQLKKLSEFLSAFYNESMSVCSMDYHSEGGQRFAYIQIEVVLDAVEPKYE